jgi:hypothetical protein
MGIGIITTKANTQSWPVAILFCILMLSCVGCRAIKPYEKEYLVHPIMDEARVERLSAPYAKSVRPNERLATASGGGASTSCPTCGGK